MLLNLFLDAQKRNRANAAATKKSRNERPATKPSAAHKRLAKVVAVLDVPMAIVGVLYVIVYAVAVLYPNPVVVVIDYVFWGIFAADVLMRFLIADSIPKFLLNNWLEILAVIVPQFRAARAIRPVIGLKRFASLVRSRSQRLAAYTVALLPLSVFVAAIAFMDVENYPAERFNDALWWAMVTVSTVGFGDVIPATDGGRIVGAALMIFGVGIFASAAAIIADWLQGEKANAR
ncbi:MAG: potassium channel family protein [Microbacteriaceae bacterium]